MELNLYEINTKYIYELRKIDPKVLIYHGQHNRPYLGIVLSIDIFHYFVPLSSYKYKHDRIAESIDLVKLQRYAVLNLNNMVPVPDEFVKKIDFNQIDDKKYVSLLKKEYGLCKKKIALIKKNAKILHSIEKNRNKVNQKNTKKLKHCCSFSKLEDHCRKKYFKK